MPISRSSERNVPGNALSVTAFEAGAERAHAKSSSQRALVIASLIRCPERGTKPSPQS